MKPIAVSVRVDRPREEVFAFLDVLANHEAFTDHCSSTGRSPALRRASAPGRACEAPLPGPKDWLELEVLEREAPVRDRRGDRRRESGTPAHARHLCARALPGGARSCASSSRSSRCRGGSGCSRHCCAAGWRAPTRRRWSAFAARRRGATRRGPRRRRSGGSRLRHFGQPGTPVRRYHAGHARRGDIPRQGRTGRDAEGRRDHGRRQRRAGEDRRGRRRRRRDGARARARRHPPRRRRGAHVRPAADQGHPGGRDDPGDGQGAHRPLRRGAGARGARGRLRRRVRGPHAGRRGPPHRQVGLQGPVRVRRDQPRRGAAAHRRGRGDDPLQGRGRHRRHRRGRAPHAPDHGRDPRAAARRRRRARDRRQGAPGAAGPRAPGREAGKLPVVLFCAGGIATPADAVADDAARRRGRVRRLGHLQVRGPATRAAAIVEATTHYQDPERVARASEGLGTAMVSLETRKLEEQQLLANRGW